MQDNMKRKYKVCQTCIWILKAYINDDWQTYNCTNSPSCYEFADQPERLSEKTSKEDATV